MAFKFLAGPNLWCLPWDSPTCTSASTSLTSATSSTASTASSAAGVCTRHFSLPVHHDKHAHVIIFTSVLEEIVCPPDFFLISTIVSIRPVRPNWCLWVTLLYYFRFLFVTRKKYGVERQGNLLTEILISHIFNVGTPLRPVCHYSQYSITASIPLRPVFH